MNPTKYPRLTKADMKKELVRRTGVDSKIVEIVITNYHDIMREALQHGVEYSLPDIGVLTFTTFPPRPAGEYWNGFQKRRMYYPSRQGYLKLFFKVEKNMKSMVKRNTLYGDCCTKEEWDAWVLENYPDNPKFARERDEDDG